MKKKEKQENGSSGDITIYHPNNIHFLFPPMNIKLIHTLIVTDIDPPTPSLLNAGGSNAVFETNLQDKL